MLAGVLSALFQWDVLFGLIIGTTVGMAMGIMPGMGATMAISLMIPVTYTMGPIASMVLLASLYTTATFGGSFTAILLHTPGTSSNAATARDGYEMTRQGRGLEAIGTAITGSLFGGVFGGVALLAIAPLLAQLALKFSSPEYFFIAIFGLTIIGSLSGDEPVKGFATGLLGLAVGVVGMEQSTGYMRYTFRNLNLMNGFTMVPVLLGLFTISQMLVQMERMAKPGAIEKGQVIDDGIKFSGKFFMSGKEFLQRLPLMIRAAVLGVLIGILPGAGGDIGSWVGYNEAKRSAKDKSTFGKGEVLGVLGSETANNAVCGGAYIPLLTLGIPGSGASAVLMTGLIIHGLQPGVSLFTDPAKQQQIYPIIIGYILANILMCILGALIAKKVINVAKIPMNAIMPIVIVLALIGSYSINRSMFDVGVTVAFGFIGYFMRKLKFPTAPVVLGIILGQMAEAGLYASIQMKKSASLLGFFASRPICWLFFILTIASIFAPMAMNAIKKRSLKV
ncbi:MAG: tripartite tricarboxylate transporter permease [Clostridia bacterium]|nr:tripartite tricarboxylate transporter permease [Clostridia bacterium]